MTSTEMKEKCWTKKSQGGSLMAIKNTIISGKLI